MPILRTASEMTQYLLVRNGQKWGDQPVNFEAVASSEALPSFRSVKTSVCAVDFSTGAAQIQRFTDGTEQTFTFPVASDVIENFIFNRPQHRFDKPNDKPLSAEDKAAIAELMANFLDELNKTMKKIRRTDLGLTDDHTPMLLAKLAIGIAAKAFTPISKDYRELQKQIELRI